MGNSLSGDIGYGSAPGRWLGFTVSGSVISMADFRKSAALVGATTDDEDSDKARHILHKHLLKMLAESKAKDVSMALVSMALFTEAVSALSANEWEPDEMVTWIRELEAENFFNDDEEETEDE